MISREYLASESEFVAHECWKATDEFFWNRRAREPVDSPYLLWAQHLDSRVPNDEHIAPLDQVAGGWAGDFPEKGKTELLQVSQACTSKLRSLGEQMYWFNQDWEAAGSVDGDWYSRLMRETCVITDRLSLIKWSCEAIVRAEDIAEAAAAAGF